MSLRAFVERIRLSADMDAAEAVRREAYRAAVAKELTVAEWNSVQQEFDHRFRGVPLPAASDFERGGPRANCNWTGD